MDYDYPTTTTERSGSTVHMIAIRVFLEFFTIIGVLSVLCNVILVFAICKFARLRRTASNKIIVNWSLCNALYLLITPATIRIPMDFMDGNSGPEKQGVATALCLFVELECILLSSNAFFVTLLTFDWYFLKYHKAVAAKFERAAMFLIALIYLYVVGSTSALSYLCMWYSFHHLSLFFLFITFFLSLVFLVVMNILHLCKRRGHVDSPNLKNTNLYLANTFLLAWLPMYFYAFVGIFFNVLHPVGMVIFASLGLLSYIISFIILFLMEDEYNLILKRVLSCQCSNYELAEFDIEEQTVRYGNGVQNNVTVNGSILETDEVE